MMTWLMIHPKMTPEVLGLIPSFLDDDDPRPAAEQIDANYGPGGGWRPMQGLTLNENMTLSYPGDPDYRPLAITHLRKEVIVFYNHELLMIMQPDKSFEVSRVD